MWLIFLLAVSASVSQAANVCGESEVLGPYGTQTSGVTKIAAGVPKPAVSLARLVFMEDKTVSDANGFIAKFEIGNFERSCLLQGLDDIGLTLQNSADIEAYEARRPNFSPRSV